MLRYSPTLLNRNVAPGIADFSVVDIPDLRPAFPDAEHWLSNHFLNTLFGPNYKGQFRQYAINMLSRAQAQFALFHQAREATQKYLEKSTPYNPSVRRYYAAIVLWESCFLNLQMFIDIYTKASGEDLFKPGDQSEGQRAYDIANNIKHWAGIVRAEKHNDKHTIPMWISNTGFHTYAHSLTYTELAEITTAVATMANGLQEPASSSQAT